MSPKGSQKKETACSNFVNLPFKKLLISLDNTGVAFSVLVCKYWFVCFSMDLKKSLLPPIEEVNGQNYYLFANSIASPLAQEGHPRSHPQLITIIPASQWTYVLLAPQDYWQ